MTIQANLGRKRVDIHEELDNLGITKADANGANIGVDIYGTENLGSRKANIDGKTNINNRANRDRRADTNRGLDANRKIDIDRVIYGRKGKMTETHSKTYRFYEFVKASLQFFYPFFIQT